MKFSRTLSGTAAALALVGSAHASITPASTCSFSDVSGTGVTVTDCSGYYVGNLNNNADFADVKTLLTAEFPGVTLGSKILTQPDVSSSPVTFGSLYPLFGDTVIGVHWGGGKGGGDTAFYRLTIDGTFTGSFDVANINPALDTGGLSNIALYSTQSVPGVPEPETYALMLAGLGVVGFMARRRKQQA